MCKLSTIETIHMKCKRLNLSLEGFILETSGKITYHVTKQIFLSRCGKLKFRLLHTHKQVHFGVFKTLLLYSLKIYTVRLL